MSENHNKMLRTLNCFGDFLLFTSVIAGSVSIFTFTLFVGIRLGINNSVVGLKTCEILQKLKSMGQLSTKRRKSMIK